MGECLVGKKIRKGIDLISDLPDSCFLKKNLKIIVGNLNLFDLSSRICGQHSFHDLETDLVDQIEEFFIRLLLVHDERILLCVSLKRDLFPQMGHIVDMTHPELIDRLEIEPLLIEEKVRRSRSCLDRINLLRDLLRDEVFQITLCP